MSTAAVPVEQIPASNITTVSESANLMLMIGRMATDPTADIDKMERLMAMKERIDAEAARRLFNQAMRDCQSEMPAIVKGKFNQQTKSKYAELEHINEAITPVYTRHGFSLSFDTIPTPKENWVAVRCRVRHEGGHTEESTYETPFDNTGMRGEVNKTVTHGLASGVSYARRYITIMIFNLTLKGEDNDGNGAPKQAGTIDEAQQKIIGEWINKSKAKPEVFLKVYKIEKLEDLPKARFREAIDMLKQKAKINGVEA